MIPAKTQGPQHGLEGGPLVVRAPGCLSLVDVMNHDLLEAAEGDELVPAERLREGSAGGGASVAAEEAADLGLARGEEHARLLADDDVKALQSLTLVELARPPGCVDAVPVEGDGGQDGFQHHVVLEVHAHVACAAEIELLEAKTG